MPENGDLDSWLMGRVRAHEELLALLLVETGTDPSVCRARAIAAEDAAMDAAGVPRVQRSEDARAGAFRRVERLAQGLLASRGEGPGHSGGGGSPT